MAFLSTPRLSRERERVSPHPLIMTERKKKRRAFSANFV
jgi:hypothetical protein